MSQQPSLSAWNRIAASVDGHLQHVSQQQQRLFRFFQALRMGNMDEAKALVLHGAPLDLPLVLNSEAGGPPRAEQFRFEELDAVTELTALAWAAGRGEMDQVKWLLKHDASPNAFFSNGRDAAWVAMDMGQVDILDLLLKHGSMVNHRLREEKNTTRLIAAVQPLDPNPDVVRCLLEHKAKAQYYDDTGQTALHYNFAKDPYTPNDVEIGRMLIEWGGNPAAVDKNNVRVADLAHTDFQYSLLRQHGLEKSLPPAIDQTAEPVPAGTDADLSEEFDHRNIIRPEAGDPGIPQLNKAPVFKKPRF